MCFPSPGPRCSAHAHAEYLTALRRFSRTDDPDELLRLGLVLEEKQLVFDTTPRGTNMLRREIDASEDAGQRLALQRRMDVGLETRKRQLAAYNAVRQAGERQVRSSLREHGLDGRYEVAAAVAFNHLSVLYPSATVEIEDITSVRVVAGNEESKYLVVPQKYQGFWGEVTHRQGAWHVAGQDPAIETVLNAQATGLQRLDAESATTLTAWFIAEVRRHGYTHVVAVDTRTEHAEVVAPETLPQHFSVNLTLRQKRGGTTPWVGEAADLTALLAGKVFAGGRLVKQGRQHVLQGVPPQPKALCHVGEDVYLSWRDVSEDFAVKRVHQSTKSSLVVKLVLTSGLLAA